MQNYLSLVLVLVSTYSLSQTLVSGRISDRQTKQPVGYASIVLDNGAGTASDDEGNFILSIGETPKGARIAISCIGYATRHASLDSLLQLKEAQYFFVLDPISVTLSELVVSERKVTASDLVRQAIESIPTNYLQNAFNMEYYSRVSVKNPSATEVYIQETIVKSYRDGYKEGAVNQSSIIEKRITGQNPLPGHDKKRNIDYFTYELAPGFDVFLVDLIGTGKRAKYSVFNPDFFKRLEFRKAGTSVFENDTISIIEYDLKNFRSEDERGIAGRLFISTRNLAFLKHDRKIGKNYFEVVYRPFNGKYFPYLIKTKYPEKRIGDEYTLTVVHEAFIQRIKTENVEELNSASMTKDHWHLIDVPHNKDYWADFRPN